MAPFKDEHILIIAPGSQVTLAQLGLPESFTPARLRIPTRMFPAEKEGEWEPLKIHERRQPRRHNNEGFQNGGYGATQNADPAAPVEKLQDEVVYEEDPISDEGAVYPIKNGRVDNWPCFFALLTHVHNTLSPPFHTPILLVGQPAWTMQDHETLTQFFFEKFKMPAFSLIDSALAVCYAFATATATVIDVGYSKCDVTAVREFLVNDQERGTALEECGGAAMTDRLHTLLNSKGFTEEMSEQLKKSAICEVLPLGTPIPYESEAADGIANTASATTNGVDAAADGRRESITAQSGGPRTSDPQPKGGDADQNAAEEEDGVLDVASIVASGKTSEFLAQKEKEKAAKSAARKNAIADAAAAASKQKLPNSKRPKASFYYHERKQLEDLIAPNTDISVGQGDAAPPKPGDGAMSNGEDANGASDPPTAITYREERKEERRRSREGTAYIRKEVEVGPERFEAASGGVLDRVADAIHRCILAVPELNKRSDLWDSLIIVGNGSKVKGFKEALLATLNARYLISPSSATIFTSELPSNFTTPVATGANTPQPQPHHPQPHHGASVNPLLLAATTASNANLAPPGPLSQPGLQQQTPPQQQQSHQHGHSQTPTSIKFLKAPEYFPEWKEVGMEEANFLGAQVAAKVVFVVDAGASKGYMTRQEYNDLGPQGIHESGL